MSIVSSVIHSDRPYGQNGQHKIVERHTDHLGLHYDISYIADADYDLDASLAANAILVDQQTKDTEIAEGIAECYAGGDPLHFDAGGWWDQVTPVYNESWDDLAGGVTIPFLEKDDQLELINIQLTSSRISSTDKKRIWGMTQTQVSDVNGNIQIAVDTQESLDLYSPPFIEGVLV